MKDIFNRNSTENYSQIEVGPSGNPIPPNGPGKKFPVLKYIIVGAILTLVVVAAYKLNDNKNPTILKKEEDENE